MSYRRLLAILFIYLWASNANATAIGIANSYIDYNSIIIHGAIDGGIAQVDSIVDFSSDNGTQISSLSGDENLFNGVFGFNGVDFAFTDSLDATTSASSEFSNTNSTSATSFLSILIPFTFNTGSKFNVSFDYSLFASADTDNTGESSIATSGLDFILFDENFDAVGDVFSNDVLALGQDGNGQNEFVDDSFGFTYQGLHSGDYYLSFEIFSASFTEANVLASAVPVPGTITLLLAGLFLIARKKLPVICDPTEIKVKKLIIAI